MFVQQSVSSYAGVIAKCQFDVHIAAERSPGLDLIVVGLAVRFVAVCIGLYRFVAVCSGL